VVALLPSIGRHLIYVQMGANNEVDIVRCQADGGEAFYVRRLKLVKRGMGRDLLLPTPVSISTV